MRRTLGARVQTAVTDRYGGVSAPPYAELNLGTGSGDDSGAVAENRERVALGLDLNPGRVIWMTQVHGSSVARVDSRAALPTSGVDALVTAVPELALAVLVADCVPVLLADPDAGVVGVAHAGRGGVACGVVPHMVDRAASLGADPGRVTVLLGPAICGGCYEVPAGLRAEVASVAPAAWCTTRGGTPGLDLRRGVEAQLRAAGVAGVVRDPRCTRESPELYSHRRDGRTGRFAGYIWMCVR